jgi:hypothetical protein
MEFHMSASISHAVPGSSVSPSRSRENSGFSLNQENQTNTIQEANRSSMLVACAGAPGDIELQGDRAALLMRLRDLQGRNLPEVVLGSRPGGVRPIDFGQNESDPVTVAMSDGKLDLREVIAEARGALQAGERFVAINQPVKTDSDIAKLQVIARALDVTIVVNLPDAAGMVKIPPAGEHTFHAGYVGTSAGTRGCAGTSGINWF